MAVVVDRSLIWTKSELTYHFTKTFPGGGTTGFSQEIADAKFQKACDQWAEPTGISFSMSENEDADILITWTALDGAGDKVGQCQYPKGGNKQIQMDFDTAEDWANNQITLTAQNYLSVALHELGHGLGLKHSGNPDAVMYPITAPFVAKTKLTTDDIDGAKFLYKNEKHGMFIVNETDVNVSWFAYNSNDISKFTALASGDLLPDEFRMYEPVKNGTDKYFIRFTHRGGGNELAGGIVPKDGMVSLYLVGSNGYHIQIT